MSDIDIKQLLKEIDAASSVVELEVIRIKALGRNGIVTKRLRKVGELPESERKSAGAEANKQHRQIEDALQQSLKKIQRLQIQSELKNITLDVTAPSRPATEYGHRHPVNTVIDDLVKVFWQMGYEVVDGPEVETEWYNFDALLVGKDHPARDMQDTFYLEEGNLPRTHTSNMQIRHMEQNKPPVRIISVGRVYRNEDEDARHVWMFNQIEGLVVDEGITMADLKGTLLAMMKGVLGPNTKLRLRPSFFPYVEPGAEMDASCVICGGKGAVTDGSECKTCSGTGWLEIGGAGMVHPQVLANVGIDSKVYSGFAFGFGAERIAMIKHDVGDLREFWRPNLKFLEQF